MKEIGIILIFLYIITQINKSEDINDISSKEVPVDSKLIVVKD